MIVNPNIFLLSIAVCHFIFKYIKEVITPFVCHLHASLYFQGHLFLFYYMNIMYVVVEKLIFVHVVVVGVVHACLSGFGHLNMHFLPFLVLVTFDSSVCYRCG